MSDIVEVKVDVDLTGIEGKLQRLTSDDDVMRKIHALLAKECDPYVPMDTGTLAQSTEITKDYVRYTQPYAHYQYTGEVYGDNIPIMENGMIVGWFSKPGVKKHPTGRAINYNQSVHPKASKEWDKAMMQERGEIFTQQVKEILVQRARELYG